MSAGYHIHPATLDAAFQAARLARGTAAGAHHEDIEPADAASSWTRPLREQLVCLRSFAPAAGSGAAAGSSSAARAAPCRLSTAAGVTHLQEGTAGGPLAQLRGLGFALQQPHGGPSNAAAAEAAAASSAVAGDFVYQTVWAADSSEAASALAAGGREPALLTGCCHQLVMSSAAGGRHSMRLRAQQPGMETTMAVLAVLQQSAARRDRQVGG